MHGTVTCQSKQGEGTTFTVTLPFRLQEKGEPVRYTDPQTGDVVPVGEAYAEADTVKTDLTGKRLLLVEDNELNREIALEILGETGAEIENAENGRVAVAMLKEKGDSYYDCVLMDIQMPLMNGYEATGAIRAMYPDSRRPIIALSANAFEEDRQRSLNAGMNAHISKPIDPRALLHILAEFAAPEQNA